MITLVDLMINDCIKGGILEFEQVDEKTKIKIFLAYIMQLTEEELSAEFSDPYFLALFKKCISQLYYCVTNSTEVIANNYLESITTNLYDKYVPDIKARYADKISYEEKSDGYYGGTE